MLTVSHVIEALTGYQSAGGPQIITDVVIDSRLAIPGALFVALPGENTDGHNFVGAAFDKGPARPSSSATWRQSQAGRRAGRCWTCGRR